MMVEDNQAGARPVVQDLVKGKVYHPERPYRRVSNDPEAERRPPVNTGISTRVLLWLTDHPGATVSECAEALGERRDPVQGAFSHLRNRSEIEYAEPPASATTPRRYRVVRKPLTSEQVQAVEALLASDSPTPDLTASEAALGRKIEQAKASPVLDEDQEQAAAELLAMETGQIELDPVSVLLWRAVMASENALAAYLRERPDPMLDALSDQAARARETLELWRRQRKTQATP